MGGSVTKNDASIKQRPRHQADPWRGGNASFALIDQRSGWSLTVVELVELRCLVV